MPSTKNVAQVEQLINELRDSRLVIGTGFTGISVESMNGFRAALTSQGIKYRVVKNTLAKIAANEVDNPEIADILQGSTGLVIGYDDPVETAKILEEYRRSSRINLTVLGAVLDHRILSSSEVSDLATLPPREALVAQLAGQMKAILVRLVTGLNSPNQQLAYSLGSPVQGLVNVLHGHLNKGNS